MSLHAFNDFFSFKSKHKDRLTCTDAENGNDADIRAVFFCSASNCYLALLSSLLTLAVYLSKVSLSFCWSRWMWRQPLRRWVWGRGDRRALTSTLSLKPLQIVPPPNYFPSFCPHCQPQTHLDTHTRACNGVTHALSDEPLLAAAISRCLN